MFHKHSSSLKYLRLIKSLQVNVTLFRDHFSPAEINEHCGVGVHDGRLLSCFASFVPTGRGGRGRPRRMVEAQLAVTVATYQRCLGEERPENGLLQIMSRF